MSGTLVTLFILISISVLAFWVATAIDDVRKF